MRFLAVLCGIYTVSPVTSTMPLMRSTMWNFFHL